MAISPFDSLPNEILTNIFVFAGVPQTTMPVSKRWLLISKIFFENVLNEYVREAGVDRHLKPFVDRATSQIQTGSVTIDKETYNFIAMAQVREIHRLVSEAHIFLFGQTPFASPSIPGNILHNVGVERIKKEVHKIELKKADYLFSLCKMFSNNGIPGALSLSVSIITMGQSNDQEATFNKADEIRLWIEQNKAVLRSRVRFIVGPNSRVQEEQWGIRRISNRFLTLPPEMECLTGLESVYLDAERLRQWPTVLSTFTLLQSLDFSHNELSSLPQEIGNLVALKYLCLSDNLLTTIPTSIGNLTLLEQLQLQRNHLTTIPDEIGHLCTLKTFLLSHNRLTSIPVSIGNLTLLERLDLYNNDLTTIPDEIGHLYTLKTFLLSHNRLTSIPVSIGNLTLLERLDLNNNDLTTIPDQIGHLCTLKTFLLSHNRLTSIPISIGNLTLLERLDLNDNRLTALPSEILHLQNLQSLFLQNNLITTLPHLGTIESLAFINIENNPIEIGFLEIPPLERPHLLVISRPIIDLVVYLSNFFETAPFALQLLIRPLIFSAFIITSCFALLETIVRAVYFLPFQLLAWSPLSIGIFKRIFEFFAFIYFAPSRFCFRAALTSLVLAVQSLYESTLDRDAAERSVKSYFPFL